MIYLYGLIPPMGGRNRVKMGSQRENQNRLYEYISVLLKKLFEYFYKQLVWYFDAKHSKIFVD